VDEAQSEMRVLERRGVDVRDAVAVAQHFHVRAQAVQCELAFGLGQRKAQERVGARRPEAEQEHYYARDAKQKAHRLEDTSVIFLQCGSAANLL
jgi:hypothetical protein